MLDTLLAATELLLRLDVLLMICGGLVLGMLVGALPGFTTVMAMAIVLPISFFLEPIVGIPFLIGVYKGGIFGGSIPAILVNIPGTGASVATTFDGPALTRKGQSRKALEMALVASAVGDFLSSFATILVIGAIAAIALLIGPPEVAAILLLSLLVIAVTASGSPIKGLVMLLVGAFLAMIGQDPIGALARFDFGFHQLQAGIDLLPLIIGLFAIPEILLALESRKASFVEARQTRAEGDPLTWREITASRRTILRSTLIGGTIGMIPGVGQVVAAFMGYSAARNAAKDPSRYGKGELDGVAAPEAANNAVNGPTMVPLLTLGIPGDNITAILLGAFVAQGLRPGPQLFEEQGVLVYAILGSMLIACVLMLLIGWVLMPLFARIVSIDKAYLVPLMLLFAVGGTYVYRSNPMDLWFMIGFGVVGYVARKLAFDVSPLVMGFILTPPLEYAVGQTVLLARGDVAGYLVGERPITIAVLLLAPLLTAWILVRQHRRMRALGRESASKVDANAPQEGTETDGNARVDLNRSTGGQG
ncbi:tripartite tricarboxylate transporter permease [Salinarimonas ramus]|uniref:C4-dicarboxylate ABC transporter permease n=1 Tax=Salinarimonas ramus TaxID=690164 RepID=A0A917Q8R3_9HYPH|nr:tripartite tricarboxylate transporter permease [Salinarimonas ramus]GGK35641.1 C4-dicarboxylate ABC transporter permease [Salinarimonas ramus]